MAPRRMMSLGMMLLAIATVSHWYLQRHPLFNEDAVDFASGLLYGLAIGTMLVSVRLLARSKRDDG